MSKSTTTFKVKFGQISYNTNLKGSDSFEMCKIWCIIRQKFKTLKSIAKNDLDLLFCFAQDKMAAI